MIRRQPRSTLFPTRRSSDLANIKVQGMLDDMKKHVNNWKDVDQVDDYLRKIMNKEAFDRSEEHTSELQSRPQLVCRLLLEKKKYILMQKSLTLSYKTYRKTK